jgi:hypothetical protein
MFDARQCATPTLRIMSSGASEGKSPADFLKAIKGKKVSVKLNSGVDYRGTRAVRGAFERCDCPDADG